ncbi:hypothetical protein [Draconibacterium halophilum]|uniref:Uncharacterized protein n=1 Tax=Draconibacterium halophilum TaxID=2706887 RepID=A0A6C0RI79_9BACT|nr:hypothetical protein [Draconibacterium halophilum]QIA08821.1 hypothetical protein G0Q07_14320 [Draconibacterium halophilum]
MMNFIYRILLTFNSTSLLLVVFAIKEQYTVNWVDLHPKLYFLPDWVSYLLYFLAPVLLTLFSLWLSRFLSKDNIDKGKVEEVEQANNAFLPSYLGYFFVALSVSQCETLCFIFAILFIFTFFSQTLYFNPLFLLFRYHFYYLTTTNRVKIFIITRKTLKNPVNIDLPKLQRINNFTFIDKQK